MRIKKNFGERKIVLDSSLPTKKYFLAFEGMKTEIQYFEGICDHKEVLKINPSIELIPLLRNHPFAGWSNPIKVFERVKYCLDNLQNNSRNVSAIINSIVEYCFENSDDINTKRDADELYQSILSIFNLDFQLGEREDFDFYDDKMESMIQTIMVKLRVKHFVANLDEFINSQFISYDPSFDEVCLIVDRDKNSFSTIQYDNLIEKCSKNNYKLFVSNPCFEFWLLLHFDDVFKINKQQLLENEKHFVKDKYNNILKVNFTEKELRKIVPEFEKNNLDFYPFLTRIDLAIENAKHFEQSIDKLKYNIGSNVGLLIDELREEL